MPRYLEVVKDLRKEVERFLEAYLDPPNNESEDWKAHRLASAARDLGYIINLAVRACPRAVQSTVRRNIVGGAVSSYCHVTMTKEVDPKTGDTYNKIHITPNG